MSKTITIGKVIGQRQLNANTKLIEIKAPAIAEQAAPGQFVNVKVCKAIDPLLRRPFGVAGVDKKNGTITLIYRIVGKGTKILEDVCSGDELNIVGPLGHGFSMEAKKPLLVGGGTGLAPLKNLAAAYVEAGVDVEVLMGGRTATELFWTDLYEDLAKAIYLTTDDGTLGTKGTVLALLPQLLAEGGYDVVYVCGPVPMMKFVSLACAEAGVRCQVSLEKYMACGIGACLSCACQGIGKRLKVCKDGPVFWAEEVGEW